MEKKNHHWVADLYPPLFTYAVEEHMNWNFNESENGRPKRFSRLDAEDIRNIYERVRILEAAEKQVQVSGEIKDKAEEVLTKPKQDALQSSQDHDNDRDSSCLWNLQELSVLWDSHRAMKIRNRELRKKLAETEKSCMHYEKQHSDQLQHFESATAELSEAKKANARFQILCSFQASELKKAVAQISTYEETIRDLRNSESRLFKEATDLQMVVNKERLLRKRLEHDIDAERRANEQEQRLAEETCNAKYEKKVSDLQDAVELLTSELRREKEVHSHTKRGLEHLRRHFASLPFQETRPPNSVTENQVLNVNY